MKSSDAIYGNAGKAIIKADHMVLIIPKKPLTAGVQQVNLLIGGTRRISWSFTVIAPPPVLTWATTTDPAEISWVAPPAQLDNPTVGYDVLVGDSKLKKIQTYRTATTTFSASSMSPGSYWVCVQVVAKYRDSACPNFYPLTVN